LQLDFIQIHQSSYFFHCSIYYYVSLIRKNQKHPGEMEFFSMMTYQKPVRVFLSYAQKDRVWAEKLLKHLSLLKRQGLISTWHDRQIAPGSIRAEVIDQQLELASLILLLVSVDFLASDYCYQTEMKRALERHQAEEARVIPIAVRPADWKGAPFASLRALPTNARAISTWSDEDNAFVDVVAGIRRAIEDLSLLPTGISDGEEEQRRLFGQPFPPIWNVPRRHTSFFTGRDQVLAHLFEHFHVESGVEIVPPQALTGLGGIGKTQTAAEYAYHFRKAYEAVLWVRAETQENLVADFKTIASLLKLPQEQGQDRPGLIQTVQEWFLKHADWLLIFDNADDLALVHPFVPRAARGHILLTTRAGATVEQAQPLVLAPLAPDDGALCLLRRAGLLRWNEHLQDAPQHVDAAYQISHLMDGLPLALEQAGAYINDTACGVKRYLRLYEQYRTEIQQLHPGTIPDYPTSVASAWQISRQMVEQSSPAAAELLRFCAFLAPEAIPDELLTTGASALGPILGPIAAHPVTLDQSMSLLRRYSLLHRESDRETDLTRLSIHRVLQEILLDEMDLPTRQRWVERAVCALTQAIPTMPWSVLQAHARNCLRRVEQWHMRFPEAERLKRYAEEAEERREAL
jgi:hypothetical protein